MLGRTGKNDVSPSPLNLKAALTNVYSVKRAKITPIRILSNAAKSIISADIQSGRYKDRANATEPAFMTPSVDPSQYSLVSDADSCLFVLYSSRTVVLVLL